MLEMPVLVTPRLRIRPFTMADLPDAHRLFDLELGSPDLLEDLAQARQARLEWLQWSVLNYRQLARLDQPPYGDRAIVLRSDGSLVGACGLVPCLNAFEQMPNFDYYDLSRSPGRYTAEVGLFYAVFRDQQRQGYASEAARAIIDYAFGNLHVRRVVATTTYDNLASIEVMRKLDMTVANNPHAMPPWLQVVGLLQNPG